MMTSPYEWKILEWDDKSQTNKQTWSDVHTLLNIFETTINVYDYAEDNA